MRQNARDSYNECSSVKACRTDSKIFCLKIFKYGRNSTIAKLRTTPDNRSTIYKGSQNLFKERQFSMPGPAVSELQEVQVARSTAQQPPPRTLRLKESR